METRKPFSIGYHHYGIIGISVVGVLIIWADIFFMRSSPSDYLVPAVVIGSITIVQVILDMHHAEEWYSMLTTAPYRCTSFRQFIRLRWPSFFLIAAMSIFDVVKVAGVFFTLLIFYYPYQKRLYLRSQNEFKDHPV